MKYYRQEDDYENPRALSTIFFFEPQSLNVTTS